MSFVNVGAEFSNNGAKVPTKKALKEAIKADPKSVYFFGTSEMGPQFSGDGTSPNFTTGMTLSVCGPDPYRSRKWYASVKKKADGTLNVT